MTKSVSHGRHSTTLRLTKLLATNLVDIAGVVIRPPEFRQTPAGVPLLQMILEHSSTKTEAGLARKNKLRIRVFMIGEAVTAEQGRLKAGSKIRVSGFLDEQRFMSADPRIVIHANNIEHLIDR